MVRFFNTKLWSTGAAAVCAGLCITASLLFMTAPVYAGNARAAITQHPVTSPEDRAALQRVLEQNAPVLEAQAAVVKAVVKLVDPSVVHIKADVPRRGVLSGRERQIEESGSGVIVQRNGRYYVLTNWHVFRGAPADAIRINLVDGREIHPQRVLQDEETDVGVLAIEPSDLIAATLGDSDRMEIGDFVLAVGSPFGLSHSVTFGIISARGRHDLELGDATIRFQDFLQTDAAINPGNSGGPLVQPARRGHRHQHGHRQQFRRQRGHRLLDPHQPASWASPGS